MTTLKAFGVAVSLTLLSLAMMSGESAFPGAL